MRGNRWVIRTSLFMWGVWENWHSVPGENALHNLGLSRLHHQIHGVTCQSNNISELSLGDEIGFHHPATTAGGNIRKIQIGDHIVRADTAGGDKAHHAKWGADRFQRFDLAKRPLPEKILRYRGRNRSPSQCPWGYWFPV